MKVGQITAIIDRYRQLKGKIRQHKQDLYTYRLTNALVNGEDANTLAMQLQIAEDEAELGKFLDCEV